MIKKIFHSNFELSGNSIRSVFELTVPDLYHMLAVSFPYSQHYTT